MISGQFSQVQLASLRCAVKAAGMTKNDRTALLSRVAGRGLIPLAKRNIKSQRDPDGSTWAPRKRGRRPLLKGLAGLMAMALQDDGNTVRIFFSAGKYRTGLHAGSVARIHARGASISMSAAGAKRDNPSQRGKMATKRQARKLAELGYLAPTGRRNRKTGKARYSTPSQKKMLSTMSREQAGAIIRAMSGKAPKTTWKIDIPARQFLGASDSEFARILTAQLRGLRHGRKNN